MDIRVFKGLSWNRHKAELCNHCYTSQGTGSAREGQVTVNTAAGLIFCVIIVIQPERAEIPNLHTICDCTAEEEVVRIWCLCAEHGALRNIQSK